MISRRGYQHWSVSHLRLERPENTEAGELPIVAADADIANGELTGRRRLKRVRSYSARFSGSDRVA